MKEGKASRGGGKKICEGLLGFEKQKEGLRARVFVGIVFALCGKSELRGGKKEGEGAQRGWGTEEEISGSRIFRSCPGLGKRV